jgi:RHS repeat-associated protein
MYVSNPLALDYMHARYYNPQWGRFLSVDPIVDLKLAAPTPQTWNRYAYVRNNPLHFTDPTGKYTCGGSKDACKAVDAAINNIKNAAAGLADGSDKRKALEKVAAFYGNAGQKNGVFVNVLGGGTAGANATTGT